MYSFVDILMSLFIFAVSLGSGVSFDADEPRHAVGYKILNGRVFEIGHGRLFSGCSCHLRHKGKTSAKLQQGYYNTRSTSRSQLFRVVHLL